jgi:hypothetical protein
MPVIPLRYLSGLSKTRKKQRRAEINRRRTSKSYKPFLTDKGITTKTSSYTKQFRQKYPDTHGLEAASKKTGVPLHFLKEVYNRGMAAWKTGHRPGATQQQWAYARVYSFLMKGKTYYTADADIAVKANR